MFEDSKNKNRLTNK